MISLALHLTLSLTLAAAAPDGAPPVVPLLEHASTPGTRIRLQDVVPAELRASLPAELLDADLGRAPSPGYERRLTREDIRAQLPFEVDLTGPAESLVRSEVVSISGEELLESARAHVAASALLEEGAELEVSRRPQDLVVPRGREGFELVPRLRGNVRGRGPVAALVDVNVDGKLQASIPVSFMARVFKDVPVIAHGLARGAHLTEADLTHARLELTRTAVAPVMDPAALIGRVARRNLRPGDVLLDRDFEAPALVRRNEPVTMVFARGALRAETFGIARETGVLGDPVRVENLATQKIVVGRVVGPGLVQMNP